MVKKEPEKQTEEKIFDAALAVFEEKGFDAARMQEIADRAGINKALLHYYFRTKDHLFEAVFDKRMELMFTKIIGVFMTDMPFEEKVRVYYREHISFFEKNPNLPIFILNEIAQRPERLKRLFARIDYSRVRDVIMKQNGKEMAEYNIGPDDWSQLMITIISLTVFPYAAQEIIKVLLGQLGDKTDFNSFMHDRKSFAADFVINSIKNRRQI